MSLSLGTQVMQVLIVPVQTEGLLLFNIPVESLMEGSVASSRNSAPPKFDNFSLASSSSLMCNCPEQLHLSIPFY